ncbi:MAG: DNA-binding domain-containing protein [Polyangiales bacterium]
MSDRRPEPLAGGAQEELVHERASAMPTGPMLRALARDVARAPRRTPTRTPTLLEAQTWFADAITNPAGVAAGEARFAVDDMVTPGPRLAAIDRLQVYHHAYHARLVECLADDYPALQHALGEDAFEALARAYVVAHPSRSFSLNFYGARMAAFCAVHESPGFPAQFASDLARLEWALVEVLHAAEAPTLSLEALAEVPIERWADARLPASETVRVLRLDHPVNAYLQAWRTGEDPSIPAPARADTAVYRYQLRIWRLDLTPAMAGVLGALFDGKTLGEALASIEAAAETPEAIAEAERNVMVWFRQWVTCGFFSRVELR